MLTPNANFSLQLMKCDGADEVYVNSSDYHSQRMTASKVKGSVKKFLLLVYKSSALKLCSKSGVAIKGNKEAPPRLSPSGFQAVHCECISVMSLF
jgi:hypothetical protein